MSARYEVLEAVADFARSTDARDWVTLRGLLADDARGYGTDGAEQVIAQMRTHLDGCGPTQHLLGNHRVSFASEEKARVWSYGRVMHIGAGDKTGQTLELFGEYDDTWVRQAKGWVLHRRAFEISISLGDWGVLRKAQ
ncbi:nuclear transport factor 2 family protein [Nocardioides dubius]|uniref:SnoaL-like domain-containing protein n=1 Tax=Nocardioides dubius TaxID=317019 RepID=A0ABP4EIX2_9ACTN